jgi:hypothetical protein
MLWQNGRFGMSEVRVSTLSVSCTVKCFSYSFDFKLFRCYFYVVSGATAALKRKGNFLMLVISYQCYYQLVNAFTS